MALLMPAMAWAEKTAYAEYKDGTLTRNGVDNTPIITFADVKVKAICVANWDTSGDGELSEAEAAAVTKLGKVFKDNQEITSFDELRYFTGVTELPGWESFDGCLALKSIVIPAGVISFDGGAFANCAGLERIDVDAANAVYSSPAGSNAIIEKETNTLVVGCKTTTIPETVKAIGPSAFWGRWDMTTMPIPVSVTSIGDCAFAFCPLESIEIPAAVNTIGAWAFRNTAIKSVTIPDGVKKLDWEVFRECEQLESVNLGNGVEEIADSCFKECKELHNVSWSKVKTIGPFAFEQCPLQTVDLTGVEKIGDGAFMGTAIEKLTVPVSLKEVGLETFSWNWTMKEATFEEGCTKVFGTMFHGNKSLEHVDLPSSVTEIGERAFSECDALTNILLPAGISSIAKSAFDKCEALVSVTVQDLTPVKLENAATFSNRQNATLYVPVGSKADYLAADIWKDFKAVMESTIYMVSSEENEAAGTEKKLPGITLTYGQAGSNDFGPAQSNSCWVKEKEFKYYNSGNGINGNKEGGTFYLFRPEKNGTLSVVVKHNGGKMFYVEEAGLVMPAFDGLVNEESYIGAYDIPVKANLTYKVYCAGSKMGFYGFIYECDDTDANIEFADAKVKAICVENWDTNGDGELSYAEAAAVTDLNAAFTHNKEITSFDELRFFTGLKSLGEGGLQDCIKLKSVILPASISELEGFNLANCAGLERMGIDAANTVYGSPTGSNAIIEKETNTLVVGCQTTKIPETVTAIGSSAFWGRWDMTTMPIPASVTTIGSSAFAWSGLEEVEIPAAVNTIGAWAFRNTAIKSVAIPDGVKKLDWEVFRECKQLESVNLGNGVEEIADSCFKECKELHNVSWSKVKTIGPFAFEQCPLQTVDLTGVEKIGDGAFMGTAIEELTVPASLKETGYETFSWNWTMKKATFEEGCTKVFDTMFHGNENLTEVILPGTITEIQDRAFARCHKLASINLPDGLTTIGEQAFLESSLTSAILPNSMKSVGNEAFKSCSQLETVDIAYIEHLGYNAFSECPKIRMVSVPATIVLDENSWAAFSWCTGLEEVEFFEGTTRIDNLTFVGCENLKYLPYGLPSTLESIGHDAFTGCKSLESITLPKKVNWIQENAFNECEALVSVTVENPQPIKLENAATFSNRQNATLYVPVGSKADYLAADVWKEFKEIVENIEPTDVSKEANAVYVESLTGNKGRTFNMDIKLKNEKSIKGYSFSLKLPEGLTVAKNEDGDYAYELSGRHDDYMPQMHYDESSKTYNIAVISPVAAGDGVVWSLKLQVPEDMTTGYYPVNITEVKFTDLTYATVNVPETVSQLTIEEKNYLKGDVNDDDDVDIADVVCVVNHVVKIETPVFIEKAADVNGDKEADLSDAAMIIDYIIGEIGTLTPAAPKARSMTRGDESGTDALYADGIRVKADQQATLTVSLHNEKATTGYQFSLILPDGVTLATDENGKYLCGLSSRHSGHTVKINYNESTKTYSVLVVSLASTELTGNDGAVMTLTLKTDAAMTPGNYVVGLQNGKYSLTSGASKVSMPRAEVKLTIASGIKGDANNDGLVNDADVEAIASHIMGKTPENFIEEAANVNGDDVITIADIVELVNIIRSSK